MKRYGSVLTLHLEAHAVLQEAELQAGRARLRRRAARRRHIVEAAPPAEHRADLLEEDVLQQDGARLVVRADEDWRVAVALLEWCRPPRDDHDPDGSEKARERCQQHAQAKHAPQPALGIVCSSSLLKVQGPIRRIYIFVVVLVFVFVRIRTVDADEPASRRCYQEDDFPCQRHCAAATFRSHARRRRAPSLYGDYTEV